MLRTFILLTTLLVAVYLILRKDPMVWVKNSAGEAYYVKNLPNAKEAADHLHRLQQHVHEFLKKAGEVDPYDHRLKRIVDRWDGTLSEVEDVKDNIAYSLGKTTLHICVREKDGSLASINSCMFVMMHELGHIATVSYGHTTEFWRNMRYLLEMGQYTGHYEFVDHDDIPVMLCGKYLGPSPMSCVIKNTCQSELRT